jgi:hypothetical protein
MTTLKPATYVSSPTITTLSVFAPRFGDVAVAVSQNSVVSLWAPLVKVHLSTHRSIDSFGIRYRKSWKGVLGTDKTMNNAQDPNAVQTR